MTRLRVDLGRLTELIDRMAAFEAQLARTLSDVDTRARELQLTWSGSAATVHDQARTRWAAGAVDAHEALAVLRSVAAAARDNYAGAAQANRRMWAL